jgi:hypothetical protein
VNFYIDVKKIHGNDYWKGEEEYHPCKLKDESPGMSRSNEAVRL